MFIEVEGHLLNPEHIVELTPEGALALSSGNVVHVKDPDQLRELRARMRPQPQPLPQRNAAAVETISDEHQNEKTE